MQKGSTRDSIDLLKPIANNLKWLIFLLAILVYANTFKHQFALDDYSVIVTHSHVQKGVDGIAKILTTNYRNGNGGFNDGLYRPLSLVTFALEKEFFDSNTSVAHSINILLYGLSCFFLFLAFVKLLSSYPKIIPFGIVLLFALHPIHTEVVANVKGRDELLAILGFSLSLYYILKYIEESSKTSLIIGLLFFIFSLISKESAVTFIVLIPLLLLLKQDIPFKKIGTIFLFLLPFAIGFILLRSSIIDSMERAVDPGNFGILNNPIAATNDSSLRWGSTFALQITFLQKLLFPFTLLHDYSFNQLPLQKFNSLQSIIGLVGFLSMIALSIWGIIKRNVFGLITAFYLASIAVASQIALPIGVQFAERLLFLPALALSIILPMALYQFYKKKKAFINAKQQKNSLIILSLLAVIYGFKTIDRNADWENNYSLYEADILEGGNSARANYNLGSELQRQAQSSNNIAQKTQFLNRSIQLLNKAILIYPKYLDAYNNLGLAYKLNGDYGNSVKAFQQLIKLDPNYSKAYFNMANSYYENKQFEKAILSLKEYVLLKPNSANAYFIIGQAHGNLKQFKEAIPYLNQAISLNNNFTDARNFLGMAYAMIGDNLNAETSFKNALNSAPNRTDILMNLAMCYANQNKANLKLQTLQKVIQIDPNHQGARGMLAQ